MQPKRLLRERLDEPEMKARFWSKINKESTPCQLWIARLVGRGYGCMTVHPETTVLATRILWYYVTGEDPFPNIILHECDNPPCVTFEHLFLGTDKDNSDDKMKKGRDKSCPGSFNGNSRLVEEQVIEIKKYLRDKYNQRLIAEEFSVSLATIEDIQRGRTWKHIVVP